MFYVLFQHEKHNFSIYIKLKTFKLLIFFKNLKYVKEI